MEESNKFLIPVSIVIAGALIAWGIASKNTAPTEEPVEDVKDTAKVEMLPVSADDHILGNPNAEIVMVEYSDLECPFCKKYYLTTKQLMEEYGKDGKMALVFRHFPLEQLHSKAKSEAIATECAAELGGNEKFWAYMDELFAVTPSNNGLEASELPKIAEKVGLDKEDFIKCQSDPEMAKRVETQFQDGINAGVQGTPHSILITKTGEKIVVSGAQSYEKVKATIDGILKK